MKFLGKGFKRIFLIKSLGGSWMLIMCIPSGDGKQKHKKAGMKTSIFESSDWLGPRSKFHISSHFSARCIILARCSSACRWQEYSNHPLDSPVGVRFWHCYQPAYLLVPSNLACLFPLQNCLGKALPLQSSPRASSVKLPVRSCLIANPDLQSCF